MMSRNVQSRVAIMCITVLPPLFTALLYNDYWVFPGGKAGRGLTLTTHPHLVLTASEFAVVDALIYQLKDLVYEGDTRFFVWIYLGIQGSRSIFT